MKSITLKQAIEFVRASIDELAQSNDMLTDEILDDRNLHLTVKHLLPEAVNEIALTSPNNLLDGISANVNVSYSSDGVMSIRLIKSIDPASASMVFIDDFLRLVYMKVKHYSYVLTEYVEEDSPIGRMQSNKYTRGTYDNPVLVKENGSGDYGYFKYYTCSKYLESVSSEDTSIDIQPNLTPRPTLLEQFDSVGSFVYIPRAATPLNENSEVKVCDKLVNATLDYLVGLVLQTYNEAEKAQLFFTRSAEMLK